jgi:hypothetical protein
MIINPAEHETLIGIDAEVLEALKQRARPFIDDPNAVLRRQLGIDQSASPNGHQITKVPDTPRVRREATGPNPMSAPDRSTGLRSAASKTKPPRAPKGSLTREEMFEEPLLRALVEAGGRLTAREVMTRVGSSMSGRLNQEDLLQDEKGVARWEKRVPFVRLKLVARGLMTKDAPRGTWEISDQGRDHIAMVAQ